MQQVEHFGPLQKQYFIDGPRHLTNALQLLPLAKNSSKPANLSASTVTLHFHNEDEEEVGSPHSISRPFLYSSNPDLSKPCLPSMPKTIVASDNDINNGFVKDGRKLPYVFEANESGTRKRSSKILPVCGVCGKRFVCVTTMKRHLVTHTGEKPFTCQICGKEYTQKGNLRVHERTHRNDRPFECNLCHQKFYRKEPMQKHQWRQHGIVHMKSRPLEQPASEHQRSKQLDAGRGVLYNSIVNQIKNHSFETFSESSRSLDGSTPPLVTKVSSSPSSSTLDRDSHTFLLQKGVSSAQKTSSSSSDIDQVPKLTSPTNKDEDVEFKHAKFSSYVVSNNDSNNNPVNFSNFSPKTLNNSKDLSCSPNFHLLDIKRIQKVPEDLQLHPLKLKKKLANAYQKEIEDEHVRQSNDDSEINENVECQCKSCGAVFTALDPFNFRCTQCNIQDTALLSHMLANPLQCLGCFKLFQNKQELNSHQTCSVETERPFLCCKCGFRFRQKDHLQKHQWRLHWTKIDSERTEIIEDPSLKKITIQDVIDRSVELSLNKSTNLTTTTANSSDNDAQPLDLSPTKPNTSIRSRDWNSPNLTDLVAAMLAFSPRCGSEDIRIIRESNPLLNQRPTLPPQPFGVDHDVVTLEQHSNAMDLTKKSSCEAQSHAPVYKKQRTLPFNAKEDVDATTKQLRNSQKTTTTTWLTAGAKKFLGVPLDDDKTTDISPKSNTLDSDKIGFRLIQIDSQKRQQDFRTV